MTQEEVLPPPNRYEACCRLCLSGEDEPCSTSLFPVPPSGHPADHHTSPPVTEQRLLIEMILECTSIQITLEEDYPAKVCEKCVETLDKFYQYRRRCLANDQILRRERLRTGGHRKPSNNNNNNEDERGTGTMPALPTLMHRSPPSGESSGSHQPLQRASPTPPPVMVVPAIRIKSEPLPLDPRGGGFGEYEEQQPLTEENDVQPTAAVAAANTDGGVSSILRSILLQTRDSTTSRSSPNTEPESPRQTPQLPTHPVLSQQEAEEDAEEEKDIKPSLLQQMLLQQQCASSPANRSPAKPSDTNDGGGSLSRDNSTSGASSASTTSSLLKRMLLDGSGSAANATAEQQAPPTSGSPLEGPSGQPSQRNTHLRTKHEPPSATNTPSPPGQRVKDDVPSNETPLASQLRSILLQHRSTTWDGTTRTASMSDASPEQQQQQPEHQVSGEHKTNATSFEKPEVSYVRSLFLRNDSDSESEPPPVEDQREMLLYAMFHELRARQQQQQQQHHHPHQNSQQQQSGFSSESDDDSDDLPQDYRLPSVRRRSTDSVESRTKRRRMEYPCLLCGRTFAGKTKLVLHMRTHMMLDGGGADGSSLSGTASSGGGTASISLPAVSPAIGGALLPNGGGGGSASDVEDVAGRLLTAPQGQRHEEATFGESVGNEDEIDALERRSYACYICGADQNNLSQLKEHLLAAHQDRIRSRGRTRERQKASIACEICQRTFRSQFAYGEHMRTHTGERPFPCDQCDKRFPRRFQLLGHLYNVHKQSWVADESKAKFAKK